MRELGVLGSGERVVDRYRSHIHPGVLTLLPESLARIDISGKQFSVEVVEFDRIIGETICVRTGLQDEIVYAQRPCRAGLSRFVRNRQAEPCSTLVVILKKALEEGTYVLISAFFGTRPEPEPWDRNATERSVEFWSSHALVWGSEPVVPGTETDQSPW